MDATTRSLTQIILDVGPWIISSIALLQVWVIGLIKWWRKPKLEAFTSGNIEIGFSNFGPTVGLMGTLRVLHKDVFVKRISAKVVREKDNSSHAFEWRAFRPNIISFNPSAPPPIQVASSFLLTTTNPWRFNIFFVDELFIAEMNPRVSEVPKKWTDFKTAQIQQLQAKGGVAALLGGQSTGQVIDDALFDEFIKAGAVTDQFTQLDRSCYWNAGSYQLELAVETVGPNLTILRKYGFTLTEEDARLLRLNSIAILRVLCGLNYNFFFANPSYSK